jgi:hypothetical protein
MLSPPFLELAYFVGAARARDALAALTGVASLTSEVAIRVPDIVGIAAEEEAMICRGVIVLRTSGDAFSGPPGTRRSIADALGLRIQERFLELIGRMSGCAYGAILVEYSLEEPDELLKDPRSLAFRNFYANSTGLRGNAIAEILKLAGPDCYVKSLDDGIYVSMSRHFNPERRSIPADEAMDRSARISAVVGRTSRVR